ncbi:MAG: PASTA domain-containing protein [Bacteroidota bacterium]
MGFFQYFKSKEFLVTIISILAIIFLLIFGLSSWLNYFTHHNEKIEVPDLKKLSLFETNRELYKVNLTFVVIDSASFNPDYPPKSVIEQNPEPGDFVKKNRKIYLTLNPSDYRKIEVPEVLDQTKRQVVTRLKSAGFRIGKERFIPDLGKNVVRKLEIKGKELKPGMKIAKNSIIDLVLGDGLESKQKDSIAN